MSGTAGSSAAEEGSADDTELPPAAELAELSRLLRAELDWHRMTGGFGTPAGELGAETHAGVPRAPLAAPGSSGDTRPAPSRPPSVAPSTRPGPSSPARALEPAERDLRLSVLNETVRACTACALHAGRTQAVFARGTGSSGLCFVGEGPGADEDLQGYPFVGAAGQLLDRMIAAMGFSRDEVYVCNIVKCRPPNNRKPEPDEMAACMRYLDEQLELVAPQVIVALGATAVQGLFGTSEGITRLRGHWKLYRGRIAVMPTFHPAYLLRTPGAKREVWADLQEVLRHMGRPIPGRA